MLLEIPSRLKKKIGIYFNLWAPFFSFITLSLSLSIPVFRKKKKTECNHNLTFGKDVYVGFLFFPCIVGVTRCNGLKKWKCNNRELKY